MHRQPERIRYGKDYSTICGNVRAAEPGSGAFSQSKLALVHGVCRFQPAAVIFHRLLPAGDCAEEARNRELQMHSNIRSRIKLLLEMRRILLSLAILAFPALLGAAEPLSLQNALAIAARENPDARIAAQRILAAQAGIDQANSAFWPKLQLQFSYLRTDNPMQVFGSILNQRSYSARLDFNDVPDMDNLNAKALLAMPLYTGGATRANRDAARADAVAAKWDAQAVRNALEFEVSRAYFTVQKGEQFIRASESALQAFEANLELARKRFEAGAALRTDVLDLEVKRAQALEDLTRSRNGHRIASRMLGNLLGLEREVAIAGPADLRVPVLPPGISERPEIRAATQREKSASERARAARSGYFPIISAFGSVDQDYGWRNDHGAGSYTAGILAQWNLWDGKLTRAKTRQAQAELETSREQARKTRLAAGLEVETARLELETAEARLAVTREAIAQAEESASLTRKRYEQGAGLSAQVIDAETALITARMRRIEAEADRNLAIAALRQSLGLPQMDSVTETSIP
jgi:outer membrane protein TolC